MRPQDDRTAAAGDVERELGRLLRRTRGIFEQLAREVHPDLDAAAYGLLARVADGSATTVTELAAALSVGKPTVSRQVAALEELGLVRREPCGGARGVPLRLTDDGLARLAVARQARHEELLRLLADWPVDDVRQLSTLLQRFNA